MLVLYSLNFYAQTSDLKELPRGKNPIDFYYKEGMKCMQDNNFELAIKNLTAVLKEDARNYPALYNRGACYLKLKDYKKANTDLTTALPYVNKEERIFLLRGKANIGLKEYQTALDDFEEYRRKNEADFEIQLYIGICHEKLQSYGEAMLNYNNLIGYKADHFECLVARGRCYLLMGEPKKALDDFKKAANIDDSDPEIAFYMGNAYYLLQKQEDAMKQYRKAQSLAPSNPLIKENIALCKKGIGLEIAIAYETEISNETFTPDEEVADNEPSKQNERKIEDKKPQINTPSIKSELTWVAPNPDEYKNGRIVVHSNSILLKIKATTSEPISANAFEVVSNGDISKMGETSLSALNQKYGTENLTEGYKYLYAEKMQLHLGENTVTVAVRFNGKTIEAQSLTIIYQKLPEIWAVIVGVETYQSNNMKSLSYSRNDAWAFKTHLRGVEGGNVPENHIVMLINEKAKKESIIATIREIAMKCDSQDIFYFFFSGHGAVGGFCPFDYMHERDTSDNRYNRLSSKLTLVSQPDIKNVLEKSKAKSKLIIADACHSGSFAEEEKSNGKFAASKGEYDGINENYEKYYEEIQASPGGLVYILSSKYNEISRERASMQGGVFTYYLIEGLKGEADGWLEETEMRSDIQNDIITCKELFYYIKYNVQQKTNSLQTPMLIVSKTSPNAAQMPVGIVIHK